MGKLYITKDFLEYLTWIDKKYLDQIIIDEISLILLTDYPFILQKDYSASVWKKLLKVHKQYINQKIKLGL